MTIRAMKLVLFPDIYDALSGGRLACSPPEGKGTREKGKKEGREKEKLKLGREERKKIMGEKKKRKGTTRQENKAGYTATTVACGWAGAVIEVNALFGQEK